MLLPSINADFVQPQELYTIHIYFYIFIYFYYPYKELDLAKHCNKDSKKFFSFYRLNTASKHIGPLKVNDEVVSRDSDVAKVLNNKFQSVFTDEDDTNIAALQSQPEIETTISGIGSVSSELVLTYLKKIRPNKAEGPDEIHARLLTLLVAGSWLPLLVARGSV